jgi:glutathione synthase/RimK-type ligase-like ATP-grasp enzyme
VLDASIRLIAMFFVLSLENHTMTKPIGILYEHPEWFRPLFAELDRRNLPYTRILAHEHRFDPDESSVPYGLVVNRVSPSAYLRGNTQAIFHAQQYLAHLDALRIPVVNGTRGYALETSKARQLTLLAQLGLPHPRSRVVNASSQIVPAAAELEYPVIVKPNIGGSGALMRQFARADELETAVVTGELDDVFGLDHTALVQEYHPPRDGAIVRVEALENRFLYAIRIANDLSLGFNLCPADICDVPANGEVVKTLAKQQRSIQAVTPPDWVVDAVLHVFQAGSIDIGGVEYLESERDGQIYLYDINALSNFVTDAPKLVGFDPFSRFVDYLERRVGLVSMQAAGAS